MSTRAHAELIDTHCHLDAFGSVPEALHVMQEARQAGVAHCVIPAVHPENFEAVRTLAHAGNNSYCLGIHPLYVGNAQESDLALLDTQLHHLRDALKGTFQL